MSNIDIERLRVTATHGSAAIDYERTRITWSDTVDSPVVEPPSPFEMGPIRNDEEVVA
jgi:hypothetical protein